MPVSLEREQLSTSYSPAAEEHASRVMETHRIPDPYYFLIDQDGDLFSPSHQIKVKKIIVVSSPVGVLEAQAFEAISEWAKNEEFGAIAWLNPPNPYPVSKVIISEIDKANGKKRILNRAIVLDIDELDCLNLGQRLSGYSKNKPFLDHLEQLRATPIVLNTTNKTWLEIMEEAMPDDTLWEAVRRGEEILAKKEALAEAEAILAKYSHAPTLYDRRDQQMQAMLGGKPESCPPMVSSAGIQTAFQVFSENALTFTRSVSRDPDYCESCPVCGEEINCVVRAGQSCPKCRTVKRCG